ncbi:MAG TPA: hypothetical protein VNO21_11925 [Polyangiaceae bacterium]|nr:hypothetical protein [Polyangiaceae bacterium]
MRWGHDDIWHITDHFVREWRFWIVPVEERDPAPATTSPWELSEDPIFHLIYYAFDEARAVREETASDLLEIYDTLTGCDFRARLAEPTHARRRLPRGFEAELERVLYGAVEAGLLRFEPHENAA